MSLLKTSQEDPATGIVIVDHGSRRQESNEMLLAAVAALKSSSGYPIVEAAHMEIAEPDVATAYHRCVQQGARRVIVFPYFLSPGKHWKQDIPALVAEAARQHPETEWLVTAPFGLHPLMREIIVDRIQQCLSVATTALSSSCDVCTEGDRCRMQSLL